VAAPTLWYVNALKKMLDSTLALGTPKIMFLSSAYTLDQDNHDYINDVSANEVTGTGVAAGGFTLGTVTVTVDGTTNRANLKHAAVSGISVSACYGVIYVSTGTPSTSPVLAIIDFSEGTATNVTVTGYTPPTDGVAFLAAA
jgi:hypothetical protein